jgi:hypothetical protein
MRLVVSLVVDYSASRRLVVDYSALRRLVADNPASRRIALSTTSPPPRVRVPRHVARLVTQLVAPLVVDYSASRRLFVDYFASSARPGASARRRLLRVAQTRRRLLRLA